MIMSASDIALKAPNESVKAANGVTYACRRFSAASADVLPLVMLQHFRGNLDDSDPLLLGALTSGREVITVDNAGVGLSSGTVPRTVAEMARDIIARVRIYPNSGHGFLFQWPEQFAELVNSFLSGAGGQRTA
jgi:pimeloyl-ACP methyl ester carboxylesterase